MKSQQKFSLKKRVKSFGYAFEGLRTLWLEEHNVRIHSLVMVLVVIMGACLKVSMMEWCILVLTIAFVLSVEALNSSLESLADAITKDYNDKIKKTKNLGAAAVLVSAIASALVGLIIFLPKIIIIFT